MDIITNNSYTPRINKGGNYCGHNPMSPRFTLTKPIPTGKGGYPAVLTTAMKRMIKYYDRAGLFPSLNMANRSERKQRSERREACLCVMAALLKHCELATLCVGIPTKDGFKNIGFSYIVKLTDMHPKRVERAVKDLKSAGFLTVSQQRQTMPDGSIKGLIAVKAIAASFFGALGMEEQLKHARDYASKNLKVKIAKWKENQATRTQQHRFSLFLKGKAQALDKATDRAESRLSAVEKDAKANDAQRETLMQIKLLQEHPEWSHDRIRQEAKARIKS